MAIIDDAKTVIEIGSGGMLIEAADRIALIVLATTSTPSGAIGANIRARWSCCRCPRF